MADRPPFDLVRASFYLVAAVIGIHCVVVLVGAGLCVYQNVTTDSFTCDAKGRLSDLLAGALAAALAFSGGLVRRPDPPRPPPPGGST